MKMYSFKIKEASSKLILEYCPFNLKQYLDYISYPISHKKVYYYTALNFKGEKIGLHDFDRAICITCKAYYPQSILVIEFIP